ncbi:MAG: AtpZ/AtpI family protein [Selenomonadaceae bacterium]|nr:AtpZ/AtpI family protein [Selenomonadaceae bacterium]
MLKKHNFASGRQSRRKLLFRYIWAATYFTGIGMSVAITVLACIWLGMKADEMFGTDPKGKITGIFLGFPVAIYSIYHQVRIHFGKKENGD